MGTKTDVKTDAAEEAFERWFCRVTADWMWHNSEIEASRELAHAAFVVGRAFEKKRKAKEVHCDSQRPTEGLHGPPAAVGGQHECYPVDGTGQ